MEQRQQISEVAIIILEDIHKRLSRVENLSIQEIKKEIVEVKNLITVSQPMLELLQEIEDNKRTVDNE